MTRDEAIEIFGALDFFPTMHGSECAQWTDAFAALGLLKLDEPKSAEDGFIQQLVDRGFSKRDVLVVRQALDYANLKIIEQ